MQRRLKVNVDQLIEFLNQRKQKQSQESDSAAGDWRESVWGDFTFDPTADESWSCSLSGIASYESSDRPDDE